MDSRHSSGFGCPPKKLISKKEGGFILETLQTVPVMKTLILQWFKPLHTQVNCNLTTKVLVSMTTWGGPDFQLHIKEPQSVYTVSDGVLVV